jgi:hypothetical protein
MLVRSTAPFHDVKIFDQGHAGSARRHGTCLP